MPSTIRNTTLTFGIAEFPVALRKASEKKDVKFEYAVKLPDGTFVQRQQVYVAAGTVVPLADDSAQVVVAHSESTHRGVWVGSEFRPIADDEIEAIKLAGAIEGIEIEEFVDLKKVPWYRVQAAYYLAPQKGLIGAKPLRNLRDAMKAEKKAALCKICLKGEGPQRLAMIYEQDGRIMLNVLAFAEDVRERDNDEKVLDTVEVPAKMVRLTRDLIKEMTGEGRLLEEAYDEGVHQREALLTKAIDGEKLPKPKRAERTVSESDDLMAALQASIERVREGAVA